MAQGSGFELLHSSQDWTQLQQRIALLKGWDASLVNWGNGPQQYPCLIAVKPDSPTAVITAYVYLSHALHLIQASGLVVNSPEKEKPVPPTPVRTPPRKKTEEIKPTPATQDDFNRSTAAHVLAISRLLIDTGIVTEERYEREFCRFLASVDQWQQKEVDAVTSQFEQMTMNQLFPRNPEDDVDPSMP